MRTREEIRAASEAAEAWLQTIRMAIVANATDAAFTLLMPSHVRNAQNLLTVYNEHAETLSELREQFIPFSDGPIKGRWSSAHEAAIGMAEEVLQRLVYPLENAPPKGQMDLAKKLLAGNAADLALTSAEVATLQERIRRERARLLASLPTETCQPGQRFEPDRVPAKYRLEGREDGELLTARFLKAERQLNGKELSQRCKDYVQVGKEHVYAWKDVKLLRIRKTATLAKREKR